MSVSKIGLIGVVVLVVGSTGIFLINKNGDYETVEVKRQDFTEVAELSGKVVPAQELDLSFEVVGKVTRVNVNTGAFVNRGDVLAELDVSEINGELNEVLSNLEKEKSLLEEISGGDSDQSKLENESENLLSVLKKSYITSDDIVKNIADSFFDEPDSRSPDFTLALRNYFLRQEIGEKRREIKNLLEEWKIELDSLNVDTIDRQNVNNTVDNLRTVDDFLSLITSQVDDFVPSGDITQSQIDSYLTNISNSRGSIASLVIDVNNAYDTYRDVLADIPVIESSIDNAQASVQKLSARKDKYVLRAPFDGIVTDKDIEPGQIISSGETVMSMISDASFEVESFVPELNIIGIDVGDDAVLTFDAFGLEKEFDATVSHVDPRETIKDGITTYKILLNIDEKISDLRSGMTNNIKVIKDVLPSEIVIPRYLISEDDDGNNYVYLLESDEKVKREIMTGRIDGKGGVLVEEGLKEGDKVIVEK